MKNTTSVLLIIGIIFILNLLSQSLFFRLDLTEDKQFTLSKATKDILKNLEDPVTVTAYFSEDLPQNYMKIRRDFQEMLVEYSTLSKGMVDYEFINPNEDQTLEQEAAQSGIQPVIISVREKDQSKQQKAFLGAVLKMGEQTEVIPVVASGTGMEYTLSTSIKKMAVIDKPSIGFIQGHGEPPLSDLGQVYQQLGILYNVENIDLNAEASIPDRFRAVAFIAPTDSIPTQHFAKMDDYLGRGGKMVVALNRVNGDFQTSQGTPVTTGAETWLREKGVEVDGGFVIDASCGSVTVQQRQGFFMMNTPVQFPFLPIISNYTEHPITKGLEQVVMTFASHLRFLGDSSKTFTPIAMTSEKSGTVTAPTYFDIQKKWNQGDFPLSNLTVGGILEGNFGGGLPARMVIFGDGDFAVSGQQGRGQGPNNISLMVNSIDWLSDDTGLIELRTKGVTSRPIEEAYLGDENASTRSMIKYGNFGIPILLIIIYGFIRFQRQRSLRIRRMQERYA